MTYSQEHYKAIISELELLSSDAKKNFMSHFSMADRAAFWEYFAYGCSAVSFAGITVLWFVSTQVFAILEVLNYSIPTLTTTLSQHAIPIFFATVNLFSTTYLFINRPGDRARKNREAAQKYLRFFKKCSNWRTEFLGSESLVPLLAAVKTYRDEMSEINHNAPDIDSWAWTATQAKLEKEQLKKQNDQQEILA